MTTYFYYISSGALNRMYTLRVSYEEIAYNAGEAYRVIRDNYICNLSTELDTAFSKAKAYVDNRVAWFKERDDSVELVDQDKVPTLEEIYIRSQEELEQARKIAEETAKAAQEAYEERCCQAAMDKIDTIISGRWPFGQYKGNRFGEEIGSDIADYGYIKFFMTMPLEADDNTDKYHLSVLQSLQNALNIQFSWLLELPTPSGEFYGEVKKREDIQLTLIEEFSFLSAFGYNQFVWIQKFVKDTGELIVYKGSSPINCEIGDKITIKATIKGHDEYKGENQTIISRPKIINK